MHSLVSMVTWHVMFVHLCTNHCHIRECIQLSRGWKQQKVLDYSDCSGCEFDCGYLVQRSFSYHGVTTISGSVIVRFFFLCDADLLGMVSSLTSALAAVSHGQSRLSIQVLLVAIDKTSVRTSVNRTTSSTTHNNNRTSITVSIGHSEDRASWYILIIKANEMHHFSTLCGKELHMFHTDLLSIVRSLNTVFTTIGICHTDGKITKYVNKKFYYIGRTCCIFGNIFIFLSFLYSIEFYSQHVLQFNCNVYVYTLVILHHL